MKALSSRPSRLHAFTFFLVASLIAAAPAAAQVTSLGATNLGAAANNSGSNTSSSFSSVAYDDKHDVYLVAWNSGTGVMARFVRFDGTAAGASFFLGAAAPNYQGRLNVRAAYSRGTADDVFFVLFTEHSAGPPQTDLGRAVVLRLRYTGTGSTGGVFLDNFSIPVTNGARMANDIVFNPVSRRFAVLTQWTDYEASEWTPDGVQVGGYVPVSGTGNLATTARLTHDWKANRYNVRYIELIGKTPNSYDVAQLLDGTSLQSTRWLLQFNFLATREDVSYLPEAETFLVTYGSLFLSALTGPPISYMGTALDMPAQNGALDYDPISRRVLVAAPSSSSFGAAPELAVSLLDGSGTRVGNAFLLPGARTGIRAVSVRASRNGEFAVTYLVNDTAYLERLAVTPAATPGPRFSSVQTVVDGPASGGTVSGPFLVGGWAVDFGANASDGSGIDAVHVWAFPPTGGSPVFLGADEVFHARSDVAAIYGAHFNGAGFDVPAGRLPDGAYTLVIYPHSSVSGTFQYGRAVPITVSNAPNPVMALDGPADNATISQPFLTGGWAVDLGAGLGTGVDAVHVWAFPVVNGTIGAGQFVAQGTTAGSRPDVGAVYGSQFNNSGYTFTIGTLAPGTYILGVYARSTVSGTFNQVKFVTITVQ